RPGELEVEARAQQPGGQLTLQSTDPLLGAELSGVREHEMRVVARMAPDPSLDLLASCRRRLLEVLLEHLAEGPVHRPCLSASSSILQSGRARARTSVLPVTASPAAPIPGRPT